MSDRDAAMYILDEVIIKSLQVDIPDKFDTFVNMLIRFEDDDTAVVLGTQLMEKLPLESQARIQQKHFMDQSQGGPPPGGLPQQDYSPQKQPDYQQPVFPQPRYSNPASYSPGYQGNPSKQPSYQGYPPQQQSYPPQQQGYSPQQPGYPPQQPSYQGYPSQQPGSPIPSKTPLISVM